MANKVGIVIPFVNLSWITINCIKSIVANTHSSQYILYLENNNSALEETVAISDFLNTLDIEFVHTIHSTNLGFIGATNSGTERALRDGCNSVMFLNNDTIVSPGWLNRLTEVLYSDPKIGLAGPMTTPPDWREMPQAKQLIANKTPFETMQPQVNAYASVLQSKMSGMNLEQDFLAFYCALIKKEVFADVGLLSSDYNMGLFDDDDYCFRLRKNGWRIFLAQDVYVHHYHNSTFIDQNFDYDQLLEKNRQIFIDKHGFDPWDRVKRKIEVNNEQAS